MKTVQKGVLRHGAGEAAFLLMWNKGGKEEEPGGRAVVLHHIITLWSPGLQRALFWHKTVRVLRKYLNRE